MEEKDLLQSSCEEMHGAGVEEAEPTQAGDVEDEEKAGEDEYGGAVEEHGGGGDADVVEGRQDHSPQSTVVVPETGEDVRDGDEGQTETPVGGEAEDEGGEDKDKERKRVSKRECDKTGVAKEDTCEGRPEGEGGSETEAETSKEEDKGKEEVMEVEEVGKVGETGEERAGDGTLIDRVDANGADDDEDDEEEEEEIQRRQHRDAIFEKLGDDGRRGSATIADEKTCLFDFRLPAEIRPKETPEQVRQLLKSVNIKEEHWSWLSIPLEDVTVMQEQRPSNMKNPTEFHTVDRSSLDRNIQESFRLFGGEWKTIKRKHSKLRKYVCRDPNIRKRPVFQAFSPDYEWYGGREESLGERRNIPPYPIGVTSRFLFTPLSLSFSWGRSVEPLFCHMALYDALNQKKISENFYFELNDVIVKEWLLGEGEDAKAQAQGRWAVLLSGAISRAMFTLSYPHSQIYIGLVVERILHGASDHFIRAYANPDSERVDSLVMSAKSKVYSQHAQDYLEPLCFGMAPLFGGTKGNESMISGIHTIDQFFLLHGSGELDPLAYVCGGESVLSSVKTMTATFKFCVTPIEADHLENISLSDLREASDDTESMASHPGDIDMNDVLEDDDVDGYVGEDLDPTFSEPDDGAMFDEEVLLDDDYDMDMDEVDSMGESDDEESGQFTNKLFRKKLSISPDLGSLSKRRNRSLSTDLALKKYLFEEKLQHTFRAMQEFPPFLPTSPYFTYLHELFVYPQHANFMSVKHPTVRTPRNIMIEILFRETDTVLEGISGMQVVHARTPGAGDYVGSATSTITYHSRTPQFYDEFKLALPLPPNRRHHILFLFYHVHCKELMTGKGEVSKELSVQEKTLIGYSILLPGDNGVIPDGIHKLEIYKELRDGYLSHDVRMDLKTFDKGKKLFTVQTQLRSTIFPQDKAVDEFYTNAKPLLDSMQRDTKAMSGYFLEAALESAVSSMTKLKTADFSTLLAYLPVVNNLLFHLMCNVEDLLASDATPMSPMSSSPMSRSPADPITPLSGATATPHFLKDHSRTQSSPAVYRHGRSPSLYSTSVPIRAGTITRNRRLEKMLEGVLRVQETSFLTTLSLLRGAANVLNDSSRKNPLLSSYVQYVFDNGDRDDRPVFFVLLDQWSKLLLDSDVTCLSDPSEPVSETLEFCWFFFDVVVKSLGLYLNRVGEADIEILLRFMGNVKVLISHIVTFVFMMDEVAGRQINIHVSLFMRDILSLVDHSYVVDLIGTYLRCLDNFVAESETFSLQCRLDFIDIFVDHEHFYPLTFGSAGSASHHLTSSSSRSRKDTLYFSTLLLDTFAQCVQTELPKELRLNAAQVVADHFCKLDYDARYQDHDRKEVIAGLYFQMLFLFVDKESRIMQCDDDDLTFEYFSVFMWLLDNISHAHLDAWWRSTNAENILLFIQTLTKSVELCDKKRDIQVVRKATTVIVDTFCDLVSALKDAPAYSEKVDWSQLGTCSRSILEACATFLKSILRAFQSDSSPVLQSSGSDKKETSSTGAKESLARKKIVVNEVIGKAAKHYIESMGSLVFSCPSTSVAWRYVAASLLIHTEFSGSLDRDAGPVASVLNTLLDIGASQFPQEVPLIKDVIGANEADDVVYEDGSGEDGVYLIRAATVDRLIESLTLHASQDQTFRGVFFLTYRSFMSSTDLMQMLIGRFESTSGDDERDSAVRLRVCNAIKHWVDRYFYDFDNLLTIALVRFLMNGVAVSYSRNAARQLKRALQRKMLDVEEEMKVVFVSAPPRIQLPKNLKKVPSLSSFTFNVLDWPAMEIARQMTLIEYDMFRRIEPKECLGNAFLKKDKASRAPHIVSMTRHFNDTSRWVIETILAEKDLRKRRDTMRKFIEIADALRQINNYNGVNEVTSGLNNASIYRLKQTWTLIPSQTKSKFDELDKLVQHPYTNLRKALQSSNPPCVPYVGVYLTDLTFIEEGNKDLVPGPSGELINLNKRRKVAKVLLDMRTYQQTPYHFEEIEALAHYIRSISPQSDEELYQLSLRVEPRKPKKT
eukprot:TRINITY_DN349_c2_g1_i1.p1 TRINITY_DN349_c2_g1~~TRINITY_DN349_c2_g1_i1.p1  ORF type:complete len:2015 (+),score=552.66 TRINITY_DN349_c2_g1_i1:127-6171(+)